jgi:hypothetical protein
MRSLSAIRDDEFAGPSLSSYRRRAHRSYGQLFAYGGRAVTPVLAGHAESSRYLICQGPLAEVGAVVRRASCTRALRRTTSRRISRALIAAM